MRNTFDYIAPYYDTLASFIFGKNLVNAKKEFLHLIPSHGRLLLMGGGTGTILNHLLESHPELIIDFIEASPKMLELAKKKVKAAFIHRVNFIHGTHHQISSAAKYDAATSFFVMDCLKQADALEFATVVTNALKSGGSFLFADFFPVKNFYHRILLWTMYRFFRLVAGIHATALPDYDVIFNRLKLKEKGRNNFLNGFIQSRVYHTG
ncbi:MAG TPA: class I SAM-dependent methyltransferase [Chitinophagales bacterium]|nr:class I SAM-dependent methyltransferase [Chitinophagales bacterium]